ncbi:glycosyltransferase family 4 protein [soil metagenome]
MLGRMRIGVAATRLGDVDGVSFEVVKWNAVLTGLGHETVFAAGSLRQDQVGAVIPEMQLSHAAAARVSEAAFDAASDPQAVRQEVERLARPLQKTLLRWVRESALDRLIVQNAWAIPMHLPLGVALTRVVQETGIPSVGHHHDYWWERDRFAQPVVPEVLEHSFPPDLPHVRHVSINSLAAAELRRRRGLESAVLPNVFDFDQPMPTDEEQHGRQLRAELGIAPNGVLVLQPTRVVPRKGIELAIELVARLELSQAVLLITSPAGDEGFEYLVQLEQQAERLGVDMRYAADRFRPNDAGGASDRLPEPTHSLIDGYLAADLITYPSLYEGFGNALVEAVYFRRPVVVNRYPVYEADIRPLGFRFVELDGAVTQSAVDEARALLSNEELRAANGRHNFMLGQKHLGYHRLASQLTQLLE